MKKLTEFMTASAAFVANMQPRRLRVATFAAAAVAALGALGPWLSGGGDYAFKGIEEFPGWATLVLAIAAAAALVRLHNPTPAVAAFFSALLASAAMSIWWIRDTLIPLTQALADLANAFGGDAQPGKTGWGLILLLIASIVGLIATVLTPYAKGVPNADPAPAEEE